MQWEVKLGGNDQTNPRSFSLYFTSICAYGALGFHLPLGSFLVHILSLLSLCSKTSSSLRYVTVVVCFLQA